MPRPAVFRRATAILSLLALELQGCAVPELTPWGRPPAEAAAGPAPAARGPLVTAANPLAAEAGMAVLRRGGSAVDAAVAVQATLGLVEPQSSGLGGGGFLMVYEAETGALTVYDGRETAPAAATPELFLENGRPLPVREAVLSGRATGVPGAVAALALAHRSHGRLAWSGLFDEARRHAQEGFRVSPRLAGFIASRVPQAATPDALAYFRDADGTRLEAGDTLRNPAYAAVLARLAEGGPDAFYTGETAQAIVAAASREPLPGPLSLQDLAAYEPRVREPVCRPYTAYVICVPPPPSSGVALLQLLAMSEQTDIAQRGPEDPVAWMQFIQLQRLMYADRDRYLGDADFVDVPVAGLLDPAYVARRAATLSVEEFGPAPEAGELAVAGADTTVEAAGTSHFVIIDADGNAVSMTTTVESVFGSGRMAAGAFFLNNQMTDFAFSPTDDQGRPLANAVEPGKRPRSSMSPVIVLDSNGRLVGALGSPGGSAILAYNAKVLIGTLAWGLPMQAAIDLPNLVARGSSLGADTALFDPLVVAALAQRGAVLAANDNENSGLHGALFRNGAWDAGADPRREGVVLTR